MIKYSVIFISFILIILCPGCKETVVNSNDDYTKLVIVRDQRDLDGCGFLLQQSDSIWLNPVNLDSAFMRDGLSIRIRYKKSDGLMTICMKGESIELLS